MRPVAIALLFCLVAATAEVRAQPIPPPNPAAPQAADPDDPNAARSGRGGPPPGYPPPGYPPPGYPPPGYPPPGYQPGPYPPPPYPPYPPYASPYGLNPQAIYLYENGKKSAGLALVLELLVPGVGSIYADHAWGAAITWGLMLTGIGMVAWDFARTDPAQTGPHEVAFAGLLVVFGGRIYGIVDSIVSTGDYNQALAQRLGLPPTIAVTPAPIRMGERVAWGPALTLRF
jgi:hypothetical protein